MTSPSSSLQFLLQPLLLKQPPVVSLYLPLALSPNVIEVLLDAAERPGTARNLDYDFRYAPRGS